MRVSLIKSKLTSIKQNLAINNPIKDSLDKEIDDLNESIKNSLIIYLVLFSIYFKFAIEKVNRCVIKPYVAGMRYKKEKQLYESMMINLLVLLLLVKPQHQAPLL